MVRIGASVDCEPVFSALVYIAVQTDVARGAFHAATTIPQYVTPVQPKFALDHLFVTNELIFYKVSRIPPHGLFNSNPAIIFSKLHKK